MTDVLRDKTALVTGSTSGIGAAIATAFAREGASVVVSGRREEEGRAVASRIVESGGRADFRKADLSRAETCAELCDFAADRFGGLDILVNNAGIFPAIPFDETTPEQWDAIFAVNARAPFFCCQAAARIMKPRGGGSIINIGSCHPFMAGEGQFAYGCSKGALYTLTRKLAMLLAPEKIRVNWITVGWVITEQELKLRTSQGHDREWFEARGNERTMSGFETEADIAAACVYLASDAAARVTGTDLAVNGALTIQM